MVAHTKHRASAEIRSAGTGSPWREQPQKGRWCAVDVWHPSGGASRASPAGGACTGELVIQVASDTAHLRQPGDASLRSTSPVSVHLSTPLQAARVGCSDVKVMCCTAHHWPARLSGAQMGCAGLQGAMWHSPIPILTFCICELPTWTGTDSCALLHRRLLCRSPLRIAATMLLSQLRAQQHTGKPG